MAVSIIGIVVMLALVAVLGLVAFAFGWKARGLQQTFNKADIARAYRDKYEAENRKLRAEVAEYRNYKAMGKQVTGLYGAVASMVTKRKAGA